MNIKFGLQKKHCKFLILGSKHSYFQIETNFHDSNQQCDIFSTRFFLLIECRFTMKLDYNVKYETMTLLDRSLIYLYWVLLVFDYKNGFLHQKNILRGFIIFIILVKGFSAGFA